MKNRTPELPTLGEDTIPNGVRALARQRGAEGEVLVSGVRRLQGGNSSEIWAFEGRWAEQGNVIERPLILRSGTGNEFALTGRGAEFAVLHALHGAGLPAPRVYWFDDDGRFFGRPAMIMDRCPGVGDRNLMGERNKLELALVDRVAIGGQMMDLLARLHAVSAAPIIGGRAAGFSAEAQLAQHDAAIARLETEPSVELRFASWWLWRNVPAPPDRLSIVHGDYRPGNMLVQDKRISAILDWEFAHPGDPAEDLGWYLTPYYAAEHLIPGVFSAEDALARYEAVRGAKADRAAVRFWSVFAMYKLAYMTVAALRWLIDGDPSRMTDSAEFIVHPLLAAIAEPIIPGEVAS
jgi:aminoglycoside phosphotransferase (APT) family kinase protein